MDLELIKHANNYILKMANGINPLTNEQLPEDDLVNNIKISRCLFYVNSILNNVINNGINKTSKSIKKIKFNIDRKELDNYKFIEEDIPISKIVKNINSLKSNENMNDLKVNEILNAISKFNAGVTTTFESKQKENARCNRYRRRSL